MVELNDVEAAITAGRLRISDHAYDEAREDQISLDDVLAATVNGEIIEQYPEDRPYPSCLVFGRTAANDPVHSVWAFNGERRWAVLVTVYRPDPSRWIDWRQRRSRE